MHKSQKKIESSIFGRTVLIIAEDPVARESIAGAFQNFQCQVLLAHNEADAMHLLYTNPQIQLVLIDVPSPISRGFEFLNRIRSLEEDYPPIFFITDKRDEHFNESFFHGVEAIFMKPINNDALVEGIVFSYGMLVDHSDRKFRRKRIRRARAQFDFSAPPLVTSSPTAKATPGNGYVTNISLGGMYICSMAALPALGQMINFKVICDENDEQIEFAGSAHVKWLRKDTDHGRPPGFGIEFENLSPSDTDLIKSIAKLS